MNILIWYKYTYYFLKQNQLLNETAISYDGKDTKIV